MAIIKYMETDTRLLYSDGDQVEKELLQYVEQYPADEYWRILENDQRWPVFYHLSDMRENILNWYDFGQDCSVLEIGGGMGALTGLLCRKAASVTSVELTKQRAEVLYTRHKACDNLTVLVGNFNNMKFSEKFDIITLIGVLEYAPRMSTDGNPASFLRKIRKLLKPGGKVLIAIENRFGLKYWCGANEDHTGAPFDGINGYPNTDAVRTYSRNELDELLLESGFEKRRYFYPLPDYKFPQVIYSDEYLPKDKIASKIRQYYLDDPSILADEKAILNEVVRNNAFPFLANSFLAECGGEEAAPDIATLVSFTPDRAPEYKVFTRIGSNQTVGKYAALPQAKQHIHDIYTNQQQYAGDNLVRYESVGDHLEMPFIPAPTLDSILRDCIVSGDIEKTIRWIDKYKQCVLDSSERVMTEDGEVLRCGFVDMTFSNCFVRDDKLLFYDQEWMEHDVPADYILFRGICVFYEENSELNQILPKDTLLHFCLDDPQRGKEYYERLMSFARRVLPANHNSLVFLDRHRCERVADIRDRLRLTTIQGGCYFDTGDGYSEKNHTAFFWHPSSPIHVEISIPDGTKRVRIDPAEGCFCMLQNTEIRSENGELLFSALNGRRRDDILLFPTTDPQIEIELDQEAEKLFFSANCLCFDGELGTALIHACCEAWQREEQLHGEFENTSEKWLAAEEKGEKLAALLSEAEGKKEDFASRLSDTEKERDVLLMQLSGVEMERSKLVSCLTDTEAERETLATRLNSTETERDDLATQLHVAEAERETLAMQLNSTETERDDLATQLHAAEAEREALAIRLNSTETERNDLATQLRAAEAERDEVLSRMNAAEAERDRIREDCISALNQRTVLEETVDSLQQQLATARYEYAVISNAASWKITKPLRVFLDLLKRVPLFALLIKALKCLKDNGWSYTWEKVLCKLHRNRENREYQFHYQQKASPQPVPPAAGDAQLEPIKFSILVPLYNTPEQFLRELIQSVQAQTYQNWELCLADGSEKEQGSAEEICTAYAGSDRRILYRRLTENYGIAGNTNQCAQMATGDYLALLDHDDILSPNALEANARAILETDADVLYSDEDHLSEEGKHVNPFFKPDWSPDLLYCQMYICHFLVFRRAIFEKIGGFRPGFDGSQDYDLMLRLSEETNRICHVPYVLYHWRESASSTAASADSKPYAHEAGRKALDAHLKRKYGERAAACDGEYTFVYDARFPLPGCPKVSIIIPMRDKWELTDQCIRSIIEHSRYPDYEILVLDNRSEEEESRSWFARIVEYDSRVKIISADMEFNWSAINNFGVDHIDGEVIVFLNNDTMVISEDWLMRIAENAMRPDIGVVGGLLLYPDNTIQHAGVVVGCGGWADHVFRGMAPIHFGSPFVSPVLSRNVLAVTGACMAVSRAHFREIGPLDEGFIICGSDVEFCIRAYDKGYFNLYDARVRLYHLESKSRDSFIPEIDFEKSFEAYGPYRENIDPYYNINLDRNSTTPKVRIAEEKMINYQNFKARMKEIPAVRAAVAAIREQDTSASCRIPEIEPINCRRSIQPVAFRLNLLIPSVDEKHVFGGIATAMRFFEALRRALDCPARIIITDAPFAPRTSKAPEGYVLVPADEESREKLQIVPFADRSTRTIPVAKGDMFMATGWWTAYTIREAIAWQRGEYGASNPLLYFIQDFEPNFYGWSSRYLLADSTYRFEFPTYAIINSKQLNCFLEEHGYHFTKQWYFEPKLNPVLKKELPAEQTIPKKKQILVYGRPGTERNAFSLIVYALKEWAYSFPDAKEWAVYSAGEPHGDIELENGLVLRSLGKLSLEEYARILKETYAGISLMVSPHPSYPPLEMATFGVHTITNEYDNKQLSTFSENIVSLKACAPADIARELSAICAAYNGIGQISREASYTEQTCEFGNVVNEVQKEIEAFSGETEAPGNPDRNT